MTVAPAEAVVARNDAALGPTAIAVRGLHKVYGPRGNHVLALRDVTMSVERGEFVCLVGASGCGKSTLLNLLAGLDRVQAGSIEVNGRVSLLFQEAALFPWLTARENVELAMRFAGVPARERRGRAEALLSTVRLDGFGDRRPHELSGGMRQRVALARALAQGADILLMDEPFGALDAMTRDILHDELERIFIDGGLTGCVRHSRRSRGRASRRPRDRPDQPPGNGCRDLRRARPPSAAARRSGGRPADRGHHRAAPRGGTPPRQ